MKKLVTIIGARPQIIKAAALSRAIRTHYPEDVREVIVHTGQHYDANMSEQFFAELEIPRPDYNLGAGSGRHGAQTARMIAGIEEVLEKERPDFLVLYGDTNSTLAGAVAASKMDIPIVHIEAGLRSFNKRMPEEVNRILTDHVSTYLFPPTETGVANIQREGFALENAPPYSSDHPCVRNVGDVMYDNSLYFSSVAARSVDLESQYQLRPGGYVLATLHRNANTDEAERLNAIFGALLEIAGQDGVHVVLPLHPRTAKQMGALLEPSLYEAVRSHAHLMLLPPVSFLEMIQLEQHAKLVITDSGGVQKEAFFFGKPCIILRAETEWVEIVESGAAVLCDADTTKIMEAYERFSTAPPMAYQNMYGHGDAAERILKLLLTQDL
jgi:UDP-GlcNAc3NAcA epimerase